ncbi:hypothetical protein [Methylobacterium nigriterrae]|uniref:hypothetical protein n=1 Tax=Methylobacterium nigriterrae TaxID=3127512 RepID=UPI0030133BB0
MGAFADLDDEMQDALDDAYGERIRVLPQASAGWRGAAGTDPTRPVREIIGRYRSAPKPTELEGNREGSKFQSMTRINTASQTVRISPAQLTLLGYVPAAGDKVVLLDRVDAPTFTISCAPPARDSGELQLELVAGG